MKTAPRTLKTSVEIVEVVVRSLAGRGPLVLAVSGGRDSMALLAAVRAGGLVTQVAAVATFDHGTGAAATAAAALVAHTARVAGLPVAVGRAPQSLGESEAAWRGARLDFLREVAAARGARLVTAHTQDDQRETVAFRILRRAGPRGLAGLDTDAGPMRPLLSISRAQLAHWAESRKVAWVEDPANQDLRHARNRLRLELLPALEAAAPGFGATLDAIGAQSAHWRRALESIVTRLDVGGDLSRPAHERLIAAHLVEDYTPEELAVLWPAILARRGVTVDWRGTERLARGSTGKAVGTRIQLSGKTEVVRVRDGFVVRTRRPADDGQERPLVPGVRVGSVRFRLGSAGDDPWNARLPANAPLTVRAWRDGDRLCRAGHPARRVARFLADAGIGGPDRDGWPVVLAAGEIVWIPGVRSGHLAGPDAPAVEWSGERTAG